MAAAAFRVGLLGYGPAGAVFHAPLVAAVPGLELAAVVTADPERAAGVGRDHPGAEVLPDADALFTRADDLDVVVVATPNRTHVPLALRALDAGLAVVVDKPLAPTVAEAEGLIARAEATATPLTVFHNRRWDGDFLTLRELTTSGRLGALRRVESRFERWRPGVRPGWREQPGAEEAGGVLFDLGPHLIDQALLLSGPVGSVYAEVDRRRPGAAVDDDSFVALTHTSGVRSHLWMSATAALPGPRFRALGELAGWSVADLDGQEDALRRGERPAGPGWGAMPEAAWGRIGTPEGTEPLPTRNGDYPAFYAGLVAALRSEAPVPVDPTDAVAGLTVIEAARRSARTGVTVALDAPA